MGRLGTVRTFAQGLISVVIDVKTQSPAQDLNQNSYNYNRKGHNSNA